MHIFFDEELLPKLSVSVTLISRFVCLFVLRFYGPVNPVGVISKAVSLPNHTLTGQAYSSMGITSIVHFLSPETDNCPS